MIVPHQPDAQATLLEELLKYFQNWSSVKAISNQQSAISFQQSAVSQKAKQNLLADG